MRDLLWRAEVFAWPLLLPDPARPERLPEDPPAGLRRRLALHPAAPSDPRLAWDSVWHQSEGDLLTAMAARLGEWLLPEGEDATLRVDHDAPGRELLRWRALTLYLPAELMLGLAAVGGPRAPRRVRVLRPHAAPRGPLANLHVHVGAARRFEHLWEGLSKRAVGSGWAVPASTPEGWAPQAWATRLRDVLCWRWLHAGAFDAARIVEARLADPDRPGDEVPPRASMPGGSEWVPVMELARAERLAEPDVVRRLVGEVGDRARRAALTYLRIQGILYRHLVVDPTERGLGAFTGRFRRIAAYRGSEAEAGDGVLNLVGVERRVLPLASVEIRMTPDDRPGALERRLHRPFSPPTEGLEWGLVLHLVRGTPARPERAERRPWMADAFEELERRARVVVDLAESRPEAFRTVCGVDLAGDERAGPLWVALPALRSLRASLRATSVRISAHRSRGPGLTVHAGEDFDHLLTGLRSVAEPLDWRLLEPGDRLGHARALGLDPGAWCAREGRKIVRRWDRLLDLGCLAHAAREHGMELGDGGLARLDGEVARLLDHRAPGAAAAWAAEVYLAPRTPDWLRRVGYPRDGLVADDRFAGTAGPGEVWRHRLGALPSARKWWDEPVEVDPRREGPWLIALAGSIAGRLATLGVAVEVNPSSNLLVGGQATILDQPLFRLRPVRPDERRVLPVAISTDDPLCFATTLPDEYGWARAALLDVAELSPAWIDAWLDEAAATSWRWRFTAPGDRDRLAGR